ncbi:MAG: hypothetical protein EBW27_06490, partial [Acidimicrobiia bacterium]|nr:hypothetical protein [Acidimicrobiia bacterium]
MLDLLTNPAAWAAFATLTALELVLGIDNIIFISILVDKLPAAQRELARKLGLFMALFMRIGLLLALAWVVGLVEPVITVLGQELSGRDLILIGGGLFLVWKSTTEIHGALEGVEGEQTASVRGGMAATVAQIMVVDLVFSLDSIITAVGMVDDVRIMIAAVIASVVPAVSEPPTASIADTRCARQATSRSVGGVTYVCRPVGKVLRWKRVAKSGAVTGTSTVTTSTTSTTTTTTTTIEPYRVPTLASSLPDLCRLRDQSMQRRTYGQLVAGFPVIERNFAAKGTFTLALIPIDFADVPGDSAVLSRVADQMRLVSDWYDMVSDGRVRIEWKVHQSWLRVPGTSADYTMSRSRSNDNFLANAAFAAADPLFDFSAVRAVAFVLPKGQTFMAEGVQGFKHSEFGSNGGYLTNEGRIENYMIAGAYFERQWKNFWSYWAHEMGHMFPLPDLYDQNQQWWMNPTNRQFEVPGGPFSGFDIMANQDGPSRTLSA